VPDPQIPTKTVLGPDGTPVHIPYFPNLGEKYQPPGVSAHEVHSQQVAQPPTQTSTPPVTNESWRERVMHAARSAIERAGLYGHAAVNALVLDDWKALTDAHSSTLQRVEGGAGLASWVIPEGKVAEIAGHAIVKAGELAAAHVAEQSAEHAIAAGVEHAAGHTQEAAVAERKWAERTPNQKLAEQHPMNPSTIWDRPLSAPERNSHFKTANDATAFLGPATERGGVERDWHHIVEKVHADKYGQFPAERVHSVENFVPVPRAVHRGEHGLTAESARKIDSSARVSASVSKADPGTYMLTMENKRCATAISILRSCTPRRGRASSSGSSCTIASMDSRKATKQPTFHTVAVRSA